MTILNLLGKVSQLHLFDYRVCIINKLSSSFVSGLVFKISQFFISLHIYFPYGMPNSMDFNKRVYVIPARIIVPCFYALFYIIVILVWVIDRYPDLSNLSLFIFYQVSNQHFYGYFAQIMFSVSQISNFTSRQIICE